MRVSNGAIVSLSYELYENDPEGELMEKMDVKWPLIYLFGSGKVLKSFEDKIEGKEQNEKFEFSLQPEEAYGKIREDLIKKIPVERFVVGGDLADYLPEKGEYIQLTLEDGLSANGIVIKKDSEHVLVDINHYMAGKKLYFKGRIENVRKATTDELVANHYIESDGVHFRDE